MSSYWSSLNSKLFCFWTETENLLHCGCVGISLVPLERKSYWFHTMAESVSVSCMVFLPLETLHSGSSVNVSSSYSVKEHIFHSVCRYGFLGFLLAFQSVLFVFWVLELLMLELAQQGVSRPLFSQFLVLLFFKRRVSRFGFTLSANITSEAFMFLRTSTYQTMRTHVTYMACCMCVNNGVIMARA